MFMLTRDPMPQYLLAPLAYATEVTVGEDHPVTEMVLRLARRRMSTAAAKRIAKKTQDEVPSLHH